MRTSFHHQPEAQHPKSPAIETPAGRLPHLSARSEIHLFLLGRHLRWAQLTESVENIHCMCFVQIRQT